MQMLGTSLLRFPENWAAWWCILGAARRVINIYQQSRSKGVFPLGKGRFRMILNLSRDVQGLKQTITVKSTECSVVVGKV